MIAAEHGLGSLTGDVVAVKERFGAGQKSSAPGSLFQQRHTRCRAGTDPRIAGLIYIAALALNENETSQSPQSQFSVTDIFLILKIGRV